MDYIKEMNAFYDLDMANQLTPNAISLYFALLNIANKLYWKADFVVSNLTLQSKSGIKNRMTLIRVRNQLVQRGLITYESSGKTTQAGFYTIIGCVSHIRDKNVTNNVTHNEIVSQQDDKNVTQSVTEGVTQSVTEGVTINKQNKTNLNKKEKKDPPNPPKDEQPKPEKIKYAEFVTLTKQEYQTLTGRFGEADTNRMIEILDNYKGSKGKRYKSDYRAILSWVVTRLEDEKRKAFSGSGNIASGKQIPRAYAGLMQMREEIEENERKRSAQPAGANSG